MRLLLLSLTVLCGRTMAAAPRPHIVLWVADDLGFNDVPFTKGSTCNIKTPTLSALAAEGVVLDNAYVNHICTPTRTSIMSARYPIHAGLQDGVILDAFRQALPINFTTMADVLKSANYSTHMVGKWHLGYHQPRYTPQARGFDTFMGYYTGNEEYWNHTSPCWHCGENFTALDLHRAANGEVNPIRNASGVYSTELFASETLDIIDNYQPSEESPLFLYLPYEAVHGAASCLPDCNAPTGDLLQAPQSYIDEQSQINNTDRRTYGGMVGAMDSAIANVTAALKKKGIWEDTLFVFTTDNGAPCSHFNGAGPNNAPLRGGKGQVWEGGVRAAVFAHGWGLPKAYRNTELLHVADWLPTFARVAGVPLPSPPPAGPGADPIIGRGAGGTDGYDVFDTIASNAPSPRTEILHNIDTQNGEAAVRVGEYKYLVSMPTGVWWPQATTPADPSRELPTGNNANQKEYVYHIVSDPEERTNVVDSIPSSLLETLRSRMAAYNASAVPPQPQGLVPAALTAAKAAGNLWVPWEPNP